MLSKKPFNFQYMLLENEIDGEVYKTFFVPFPNLMVTLKK